jgi:hypothetical protein
LFISRVCGEKKDVGRLGAMWDHKGFTFGCEPVGNVKCRGGNQQTANTLFARPAAKTNDGAWAIFHFGFINNIV